VSSEWLVVLISHCAFKRNGGFLIDPGLNFMFGSSDLPATRRATKAYRCLQAEKKNDKKDE